MTSPWNADFPAEVADELKRMQADALDLKQRVEAVSATATSPQNLVTITVGAQAEVVSITFNTKAYRKMAPAELATILVDTIEQARQQVMAEIQDMLPPLPFGGSPGEFDLDAFLPGLFESPFTAPRDSKPGPYVADITTVGDPR